MTKDQKAGRRQGELGNCRPPKEHQFKPGQSGNPKGMTKGTKYFKTRMSAFLEKNIKYKDLDNTVRNMEAGEALIISLFAKAIYKGDVTAAKEILERTDGKVVQENVNMNMEVEALEISDDDIIRNFLKKKNKTIHDNNDTRV